MASSEKTEKAIVVTGFGPFEGHETNASWAAVRKLPNLWRNPTVKLMIEEIPVSYDYVQKNVPGVWTKSKPELDVLATFHVGVSPIAKKVTLEGTARNVGYCRADVDGRTPDCERCVADGGTARRETNFDLGFARDRRDLAVSDDAGLYLCEFVYYKSLDAMNGDSLFIHVPCEDVVCSEEASGSVLNVLETVLDRMIQKRELSN